MDYVTLVYFRRSMFACFLQASDALMNLGDALWTETPARSLIELWLSPFFTRRSPIQSARLRTNRE